MKRGRALNDLDVSSLGLKKFQPANSIRETLNELQDYREEVDRVFTKINSLAHESSKSINILQLPKGVYSVAIIEDVQQTSKILLPLCSDVQNHNELDTAVRNRLVKELLLCVDLKLTASADDIDSVLAKIDKQTIRANHSKNVLKEFQSCELLSSLPIHNVAEKQIQLQSKVNALYLKLTKDAWTTQHFTKDKLNLFLNEAWNLLEKKQEYFSSADDLFRTEFAWFSFYNSLTAVQQQLIGELKHQSNWEKVFSTSYLHGLLVESADGNLPYDDSELKRLPAIIEKAGKEQGRYIQQYWCSKQWAKEQEFTRQPHGLSVEIYTIKEVARNLSVCLYARLFRLIVIYLRHSSR